MKPSITTYSAQKILNVRKYCDGGWFWNKYSAYPYLGCYYGCLYCYEWDRKYTPFKNPSDFDQKIWVKENAVDLLASELASQPTDIIMLGDWQPIEKKYRLSRAMLKVVQELNFPVFINEKSPLLLQDLDLISAISQRSYANVGFSIITTQDDHTRQLFEPKAPKVESRFAAMAKVASAGILTGTVFVPILPFIYDTPKNIQAVVKMTKECGGKYVLAGGLTLFGYCKEKYYEALKTYDSKLIAKYERLYRDPNELKTYHQNIQGLVKKYCQAYRIWDTIPRPVHFFPKKTRINKLIAERLYLKVRDLPIQNENQYRIQVFLKVAHSIDEAENDILTIYQKEGKVGLKKIKGVGDKMADVLQAIINDFQ
uniref:Radical SAM protein n=1 Tax=candidate division WOR-3 bacterium TaxID=2052148 RepID=A0A7C6ECX5_UNCW3